MTGSKKVAIITGGAQGIGKGIAKKLLAAGQAVVLADLDREAGEETLAEFAPLGHVRFIRTDVSDEGSAENCIDRSVAEFGRIDALVNNAGIARPFTSPLEALTLADWNRIIGTNLTGCFLMAKYAIPYLRRAKGCIVNIGSTRALQSEPDTEAYSASKGGLLSFSHALAISLGPEVRVNCISPGYTATEMTLMAKDLFPTWEAMIPMGRLADPEELAGAVIYLASDAASYTTGTDLIVDGGFTSR